MKRFPPSSGLSNTATLVKASLAPHPNCAIHEGRPRRRNASERSTSTKELRRLTPVAAQVQRPQEHAESPVPAPLRRTPRRDVSLAQTIEHRVGVGRSFRHGVSLRARNSGRSVPKRPFMAEQRGGWRACSGGFLPQLRVPQFRSSVQNPAVAAEALGPADTTSNSRPPSYRCRAQKRFPRHSASRATSPDPVARDARTPLHLSQTFGAPVAEPGAS